MMGPIVVSGRWDDDIVLVDPARALDPANFGSDRAVLAHIRTTPEIPTPLGIVRGSGQPVGMTFSPDRRFAYVVNHSGSADPAATARFQHGYRGTIAIVDLERRLLVDLIETGTAGPVGSVLLPDGRTLAVTSAEATGFEDGGCVVTLIDTIERRVLLHVPLATGGGAPCAHPAPHSGFGGFPCPNGIAFTPRFGGLILTANGGTDDVSLILLDRALAGNEAEIGRVRVGTGPFGIAISPDGRQAAIANRDCARTGTIGRTVSIVDIAASLDGHANAVREIHVTPEGHPEPPRPFAVAYTPDGTLLVTCFAAGSLAVLDPGDGGVRRHIPLPSDANRPPCPRGIAILRGGPLCAIAGGGRGQARSGQTWIVDYCTGAVTGHVIGTGNEPYLLGFA